jgi:hypothetical protein
MSVFSSTRLYCTQPGSTVVSTSTNSSSIQTRLPRIPLPPLLSHQSINQSSLRRSPFLTHKHSQSRIQSDRRLWRKQPALCHASLLSSLSATSYQPSPFAATSTSFSPCIIITHPLFPLRRSGYTHTYLYVRKRQWHSVLCCTYMREGWRGNDASSECEWRPRSSQRVRTTG